MPSHVCPWWAAYTFDHRFRRIFHRPEKILGPYVRRGMTVMDVGCGMGFFSIGMARLVGDEGRVIAVDVQQQMLDVLKQRAEQAGVAGRIRTHPCRPDLLGVDAVVDFALAFWVVHEAPHARHFLSQVHSCLGSNARFLLVEPRWHVSSRAFQETLATARDVGLSLCEEPRVRMSRSAVFLNQ